LKLVHVILENIGTVLNRIVVELPSFHHLDT